MPLVYGASVSGRHFNFGEAVLFFFDVIIQYDRISLLKYFDILINWRHNL